MPKQSYREEQAAIMNAKRASERDIGAIPEVVNPQRRALAESSSEMFARTYFPEVLYNELTDSHIDDFNSIDYIIDNGGKKVKAAPRGDGKTTRIQIGAMRAAFTGKKKFIAAIGADKQAADDIIEWIRTEVETNDLLLEDFPEICYPVRCLEGIPRRAPAQTCGGERTRMEWTTSQLVFPTVEGSPASGVIVRSYGMTARIRGAKVGNIRPDFVIIDDPQTKESAKSWTQVIDREKVINQDIKGLAGQGKQIAIFILCTVIEDSDLASRMLNPKLHPDWEQSIVSLIETWPTNMELWEKEYHEVWVKGIDDKDCQAAANKFYRDNKEELEADCVLSNPFRMTDNDESAIQHAMHLYFEDRAGFFSEYQNRPLREEGNLYDLKPEKVQSRLNGLSKNQVPEGHNMVVACADVNYIGLNTVVSAFSNDFTGCCVDYFKFPEGARVLYDSNKSNKTTQAQAISLGIQELIKFLMDKPYANSLDALTIDANFMTETVVKAIKRCLRQLNPPFLVLPFRGRSFRQYRVKKSTLVGRPGLNCHMEKTSVRGKQFIQDSDYWRMTAQQAFLLEPSQPGSYSFWGKNDKRHGDIAAEICSEKLSNYSVTPEGAMYKWTLQVGALNDKLDALVGTYSMANVLGAELTGGESAWRNKRKTKRAQEEESRKPKNQQDQNRQPVREQRIRQPARRRRYR